MNKYLLLRDNKQTGPYTVEDIQQLGLKPYDLVWVDGRSAAWRYPGEIEELKPFAPPLVEQPFDRFYKKPSVEKKIEQAHKDRAFNENEVQENKPVHQTPKITSAEENGKTLREERPEPRRPKYVSVSLPSGSVQDAAKKNSHPELERPPVNPKPDQPRPSLIAPEEKFKKNTTTDPALLFPDRTIRLESQKAEKAAIAKPSNSSRKKGILTGVVQGVAIAAGLVSLVAVGILIGMSIGNSKTIEVSPSSEPVKTELTAMNIPATADSVSTVTFSETIDTALKTPVKRYNDVPRQARKKTSGKENLPVAEAVIAEPVIPEPQTSEVKAQVDKAAIQQTITKKISIETNDYKVGMFGGIDDVKVTVHNGSEYPVDLVVVDVSYIQSNKKSYKTESLRFNNIAANSSLTLEAPKTNKGIKVQTTLSDIRTAYGGL